MWKELKTNKRYNLNELQKIIKKLRDPIEGCEWDINQTSKTLSPQIIEEAYELVEAIEGEKKENIIDELGDLLLQIIFQCQIANEQMSFKFEDIVDNASKKMIRRHPHIFSAKKEKRTIEEQKLYWEKIKKKERQEKGEKTSPFSKFNKFQPSIIQAVKMQKTASTLGLDFSNIHDVILKIEEEFVEVKEALKIGNNIEQKNEIGDLLFSIINLSRYLDFDPEQCIYKANKKFSSRCEIFFKIKENLELNSSTSEIDSNELWEKSKKIESQNNE